MLRFYASDDYVADMVEITGDDWDDTRRACSVDLWYVASQVRIADLWRGLDDTARDLDCRRRSLLLESWQDVIFRILYHATTY